MDPNIAAWMIAGGPHVERPSERREREQLQAFLESRRGAEPGPTLVDRLRSALRPAPQPCLDPACCPA